MGKSSSRLYVILLCLALLIGCMDTSGGQPLPSSGDSPKTEENAPKAEKPVNNDIKLVKKEYKAKYLLNNGIGVKEEEKHISTSKGEVQVLLAQFSGLFDKAVEDKINKDIENEVLKEALRYSEEADHLPYLYCGVELNANNLLSISMIDFYSLPLYGMLYRLTDGERLYLKDIFTEQTEYIPLVNRKIRESMAAMGNEEDWLIEPFTTIKEDQDFALSEDSLFIIFRDGEGGFNGRKTVTIPLVSIDDYVDIIDQYSETDPNIYEIKDLMVNKNNIFITEKGYVIKKNNGEIWTHYPVISGLRDESFERVINNSIKAAIEEAAASEIMESLEKNPDYPDQSIANIEMDVVFNRYGFLTIKRSVSGYKDTAAVNSLTEVYSFDLKEKKPVDATELFGAYMANNLGVEEDLVAEVKRTAMDIISYSKPELTHRVNLITDYNFIKENSIFYFEEQWGQDVGIVVLLKENVLEGISTSIWCVIPFNNVINMTAENFFESVWE